MPNKRVGGFEVKITTFIPLDSKDAGKAKAVMETVMGGDAGKIMALATPVTPTVDSRMTSKTIDVPNPATAKPTPPTKS